MQQQQKYKQIKHLRLHAIFFKNHEDEEFMYNILNLLN